MCSQQGRQQNATLMLPSSYRIGSPGRYCQEPWKSTTPERHATATNRTCRAFIRSEAYGTYISPASPTLFKRRSSHLTHSLTHSHSLGMRATTIRELGSRPPPCAYLHLYPISPYYTPPNPRSLYTLPPLPALTCTTTHNISPVVLGCTSWAAVISFISIGIERVYDEQQ